MRIPCYRIVFATLLIALLLSACQPAAPQPTATATAAVPATATPSPTSTEQPTATPTPPWMATSEDLQGIQIRLVHPWSGDVGHELDRLVDEFNQANEWGVHVIAASTGSQAAVFDQAVQALEAGNPPQMIVLRADQALTLAQQRDALVDLSAYSQDPVFGVGGQPLEDTPAALLDPVRLSGRWIGMPVLASGAVLFYNQSWGRELGFDEPPQTPAEFRAQACAAAEANRTDDTRDNDGTGGWLVDTSVGTVLSWLHGFGVQEFTGSGPLNYRFQQPASLEAFHYLRGLLDENCAWLGRLPAPYEYFTARNALFYSGSVEDILVQERTQSRLSSADEWTVLPYPRLEGQPAWEVEGLSLVVTRGSNAQQLAAWLFVRWMSEPTQQARLSRAGGLMPASSPAVELLADFRQQHPQWDAAISRPAPQMFSPPPLASWRVARLVVEDGAWQIFQAFVQAGQIPSILSQIDATIQEVGFNLGY